MLILKRKIATELRHFSSGSKLKESLELLGLSHIHKLSKEHVKAAYREKALKYHPDLIQTP